jgi:hypothetical protein
VLHVKGFSFDGLCGYNVVDKAREALGEGVASQRSSSSYFKNGARPSVVLEAPVQIPDEQKNLLRSSWERLHTGPDNMHKTAILDRGLKANVLSFNARDMQLIQGREFNLLEIANYFGLPPHKLGSTARTSYGSLEQENQACLDEAFDPWLRTWEEECWDKLLTEEEKDSDEWEVEFDRQELVKADSATQAVLYRAALGGAPWMTRNEVRGRMHLPPKDGGDELLDPKNMGQGGFANEPTNPADSPTKPPAGELRPLIEDAGRRMVRRIGHAAKRAAKKPADFLVWLDGLEHDHLQAVIGAYWTVSAAAMFDAEAAAQSLLARVREGLLEAAGDSKADALATNVAARLMVLESESAREVADEILGDRER